MSTASGGIGLGRKSVCVSMCALPKAKESSKYSAHSCPLTPTMQTLHSHMSAKLSLFVTLHYKEVHGNI